MNTITIRKPDDFHVHVRDGAMLKAVLPYTAQVFARALIMPNLAPEPVTTTERLRAYRERITAALGTQSFTPLMSYYLTDESNGDEIVKGFTEGIAAAVKMYPAGATTNSAHGVTNVEHVFPIFEKMEEVGMPLLLHGEALVDASGNSVDPFDREKVFLDLTLSNIRARFPKLKVVLEHATTKDAVQYVRAEKSPYLAATFTVQHLMLTREDLFNGGLQPHHFCLPVLKRREHREALRDAATSGEPHFFLGTDSAPHPTHAKERAVGCAAGMFTAPAALSAYAEVFETMGRLEHLEKFASMHGATFYGLPLNQGVITLKKEPWSIDERTKVDGGDTIRPFGYHEEASQRHVFTWKITNNT